MSGGKIKLHFFKFHIMRESFTRSTKIGKERNFLLLEGCVFLRGVTF